MASKPKLILTKEKFSAGVGGAASGTGLIGVVNSLNIDASAKQALLLITPWVSLVLAILFNWALRELKDLQGDIRMERQYQKAKKHRDDVVNDPNSTEEEIQKVKEWFSSLQAYKRDRHEQILQEITTQAASQP